MILSCVRDFARQVTDMRAIAVCASFLVLAACAARPVTPVAMSQPGDAALDCAALSREIEGTARRAAEMARLDQELERRNVVGAILFGAPAIDLTREEQIQFRALADRTRHLTNLKAQKSC